VPAPGALGTPGLKTAGVQPIVNPAAAPAYRTIPARNVRTTPVESQAVVGGGQADAAVQRIMLEAQKVQAEREGKAFPPLPPLPGR